MGGWKGRRLREGDREVAGEGWEGGWEREVGGRLKGGWGRLGGRMGGWKGGRLREVGGW
jgi:hypothetical protein